MWGGTILSISFALIIALTSATSKEASKSTVKQCSTRRTSPIREILCYTSTLDIHLLVDSVCSCTTLVHHNYDVRNLSIYDITDLRRSLREIHPSLQFVISIKDDAKMLSTSATVRQEIIAQIVSVLNEVDGIELNMTASSKERLRNFVKSLRDEITRKSYEKRIIMALPSKPEDLAKQYELKELVKYVDLFTLPTDYLTDNDGDFVTFHPSRLMGLFDMLNTDSLVDLVSELGTPKRKILVSLPANAYRFTLKDEEENAPRSRTIEKNPVAIDRKELCETMSSENWTVERDEDLTAPYAFQNNTWIAFEDKISVGIKGKYALLKDLAGLAVRDIENDINTECEKPITEEIYHSFVDFKRKSRLAVLNALEDELHEAQFSYPNQAKSSNFRVVRMVDTDGHIRAVRQNTQTEFACSRQGYFVHPRGCNRFYRCVKFNQEVEEYTVFEFDCPAGLLFDERTEVCVWPGSLPQGSPCPGSSEIAPVILKRFTCPSEPGYYADPQNCRWFFACIDMGEEELMAFEFRCPYSLVFDETKLICDWPWLVPACSESGSAYSRAEYDYRGNTAGHSSTIGTGGYVTGGLPEYSVTAGAGYPGMDYYRTSGVHETGRVNYFGSTGGRIDGSVDVSTHGIGAISGHAELTSPVISGYSGSTRVYGGSVSSVPGYSGSPSISGAVTSRPNVVGEDNTGYFASNRGISSTEHTLSASEIGYAGSIDGFNIGSLGGGTSGYSESTVGGYAGTLSGSHFTKERVNYPETSGTSYFESTGLHTSIPVGSIGSSYAGSSGLYTKSGTYDAGSYASSMGTYTTERQSLPSTTGPLYGTMSSYSKGSSVVGIMGSRDYSGSTVDIDSRKIDADYHKGTSGINTGSFGSNINLSTDEEKYTIPIFTHREEPIYPSMRTTGGTEVRNYTETFGIHGVTSNYDKTDLTRPYLNVSIFDNGIPGTYGVRGSTTGVISNEDNVEGSIYTSDFLPGIIYSHGSIPGTISTSAVDQDVILGGRVQPDYIHTSVETPGYVIGQGVKNIDISSGSSGILTYGTPTPAILLTGTSRPDTVLQDHISPSIIRSETITGSTDKPYVSQSRTTYHDISGKGSASYSSGTVRTTGFRNYKDDKERGTVTFNTDYVTNKYLENDIPDYRPTSAILPDSFVPVDKAQGTKDIVFGSTLIESQKSSTPTTDYSPVKPGIFTSSEFTKTGPTRTGITTAVLGGGGSYSVSKSESRPISKPDNIGEKAFEGNVAGYTKTSSIGLSSTLTPPDYPSTMRPATFGYSYPKPTVQFGTNRAPFSSTIEAKVPITTPTSFLNVEVHNGSPDITNVFGSRIPTPSDNRLLTPTTKPPFRITVPDTYQTTLFEATKVLLGASTVRPVDSPFRTTVSSSISDSNYQKDHSFYTSSPAVIKLSAPRYDVPTVTERPGVTYKKPPKVPGVNYGAVPALSTLRRDEGFSTVSSSRTNGGSPTNLDISKDKINKLITNYDRGTVKYTPSTYDTYASSHFISTSGRKFSSLLPATKSSFNVKTTLNPYDTTTRSSEGKGKVIVKWSDLHPILLGKLGAECACKTDPFATLRGPAKRLKDSAKVDLANYGESDVYVDLEKDYSSENSNDYITDYRELSPKPYKISDPLTMMNFTNKLSSNLSSSYLPANTRDVITGLDSHAGLSRKNNLSERSSRLQADPRIGKRLKDVRPTSSSSISTEEEDDSLEIINGATDCARPGLFRHPSLCNKFYVCHWDQWKKKFTLHIFNCPIHLTFDAKANACNWPSKGPACQGDNLLV